MFLVPSQCEQTIITVDCKSIATNSPLPVHCIKGFLLYYQECWNLVELIVPLDSSILDNTIGSPLYSGLEVENLLQYFCSLLYTTYKMVSIGIF